VNGGRHGAHGIERAGSIDPALALDSLLSVPSQGLALRASSRAMSGNHAPAAGSITPRTGSGEPAGAQRLHWPSDWPGILIHR
jgi:hypothetical protein